MKKTPTDNITREAYTQSAELRVRDNGEGSPSRTIEGYAIRFGTPSAPLYEDDEEVLREVIESTSVTKDLLDRSDIKFTLFHDNHLLLARSKNGEGTLSYEVREEGVWFSFDAPATADGDKALALVRAGIIDGCSFAFSTYYRDKSHVAREVSEEGGKRVTTCRVKKITGIYDMTLTPDPAYPSTSVEARSLLGVPEKTVEEPEDNNWEASAAQLREIAARPI